ncbi:MAG: hypothetical protein DCC65_03175 [Planctomycetota bacterium]|nr:MAG: hypothetical protein DCC65_03175 [Planctomycetota bacterium]
MNTTRNGDASLAILGSYPPPYGGVAVHVQRLGPLLESRGISYVIYNGTSDAGDGRRVVPIYSRRRSWMIRYLFVGREPAVYILSDRLGAWLIGALMASLRGKRVMVRLRNVTLPDLIRRGGWRRWLAGYAMRRMAGIVCVSRQLQESAGSLGVEPGRLFWSPGFLPPDIGSIGRKAVDAGVWPFVEAHSPVVAANGKVNWYEGTDLYGLDMLVELAARLKGEYPRIGIVVCFWDFKPVEQARLNELMARARQLGVAENLLFNTARGEFVPVLAESDVFVRPTNTDGDANSIREALYLGVPAVASDVVERPEGTILFRTRDMDDFEEKVRAALKITSGSVGRPRGLLAQEDRDRIEGYLALLSDAAEGRDPVAARGAHR